MGKSEKIELIKAFYKGEASGKYFSPDSNKIHEIGKVYIAKKGKPFIVPPIKRILENTIPMDGISFLKVEGKLSKKHADGTVELNTMELIDEIPLKDVLKFDSKGVFAEKALIVSEDDKEVYKEHALKRKSPKALYVMALETQDRRAIEALLKLESRKACIYLAKLLRNNLTLFDDDLRNRAAEYVFKHSIPEEIYSAAYDVKIINKTGIDRLLSFGNESKYDTSEYALRLSILKFVPEKYAKMLQEYAVNHGEHLDYQLYIILQKKDGVHIPLRTITKALLKRMPHDKLQEITGYAKYLGPKETKYILSQFESKGEYIHAIDILLTSLSYNILSTDVVKKYAKRFLKVADDVHTIAKISALDIIDDKLVVKKLLELDPNNYTSLRAYMGNYTWGAQVTKYIEDVLIDMKEYEALCAIVEFEYRDNIVTEISTELSRLGRDDIADCIMTKYKLSKARNKIY